MGQNTRSICVPWKKPSISWSCGSRFLKPNLKSNRVRGWMATPAEPRLREKASCYRRRHREAAGPEQLGEHTSETAWSSASLCGKFSISKSVSCSRVRSDIQLSKKASFHSLCLSRNASVSSKLFNLFIVFPYNLFYFCNISSAFSSSISDLSGLSLPRE